MDEIRSRIEDISERCISRENTGVYSLAHEAIILALGSIISQGAMAVNDQDVEANCGNSQIRNSFSEIQLLPWRNTKVPAAPVEPPLNQTGILDSQRREFRQLYKTIYFDSDESLHIKVGTGIHATCWIIRKSLICHYSQSFKAACNSGFAESQSNDFVLSEDSPIAFSLFVEWIYTWNKAASVMPDDRICKKKLGQPYNPWCQNSHLAWILADKLLAHEFSRFALMIFISHSVCIRNERTFRFVQDNTMENSALASYARKWKMHQETKGSGHEMADPRTWEIDHWYTACSRDIGLCRHQCNVAVERHQSPKSSRRNWVILFVVVWFFIGVIVKIISLAYS